MTLRQIRKTIFIIILVLLAGGAGWWARGLNFYQSPLPSHQASGKVDLSLFWDVWQRLEENYLDKNALDPQKMVYGAIKGMTQSLGDPYTVFLEPSENKKAKEELNGNFEGVGIQLGYNQDKQLVVIAPLKGTPAYRAGVKAGDLILRIKDEKKGVDRDTAGISLPEAVNLIRGPKGQPVVLTLLSQGEKEPHDVEIIRSTIIVPSVEVEFLENKNGKKVAYLKLMRFGERTKSEWRKAVDEILAQKEGLSGTILDLRDNPGGYLEGAVYIASEFLSSGVVVQQQGKAEIKTYSVDRKGKLLTIPLVVLVNQGSASASEILAGALKDYHRARLVGESTFGKGTVQEALDLPYGAGLHITTARWLLPSGKWIGEDGIKPDFVVKSDETGKKDLQLKKAIEVLTSDSK